MNVVGVWSLSKRSSTDSTTISLFDSGGCYRQESNHNAEDDFYPQRPYIDWDYSSPNLGFAD